MADFALDEGTTGIVPNFATISPSQSIGDFMIASQEHVNSEGRIMVWECSGGASSTDCDSAAEFGTPVVAVSTTHNEDPKVFFGSRRDGFFLVVRDMFIVSESELQDQVTGMFVPNVKLAYRCNQDTTWSVAGAIDPPGYPSINGLHTTRMGTFKVGNDYKSSSTRMVYQDPSFTFHIPYLAANSYGTFNLLLYSATAAEFCP